MKRSWIRVAACLSAMYLLAAVAVFGQAGKETETKGIISSRTGETLRVKTTSGDVTVLLTDETRTRDNKGILGLRKEYMANTVLIPGLKLKVKGNTDDQGRVIAKTITVDGDDLETAEMIQAGLHPTAAQVAANEQSLKGTQQTVSEQGQAMAANTEQIQANMKDIQENTDRFSNLGDYDVHSKATVNFDVNSSTLSPDDKQKLSALAKQAVGLTGYIVEVKGFTDSSGSAAMNQQLSEDRADSVVNFLTQQANVPVRHIIAPGAMGEYKPAASNETAQGRAENRRVEVSVLTNKGIAGK